MELSNVFVNDDILYHIYDQLSIQSKLSFSKTNRYLFDNYHKTCKQEIFKHINENYSNFRLLLHYLSYSESEKQNILQQSVDTIQKVEVLPNLYRYDLRFLFELMMKHYTIFKAKHIPDALVPYLHRLLYCKSFDRSQTLWRVHDEFTLYTLHQSFQPYYSWVYVSIDNP